MKNEVVNSESKVTVIETEIYEPYIDKPGFLRYVRQRTIEEVFKDVVQFLKEQGYYGEFEYFKIINKENSSADFPKWREMACYATCGSNEGHFVNVDAILYGGEKIVRIYTGKTFSGMDCVLKISNALTKVFWDEFK